MTDHDHGFDVPAAPSLTGGTAAGAAGREGGTSMSASPPRQPLTLPDVGGSLLEQADAVAWLTVACRRLDGLREQLRVRLRDAMLADEARRGAPSPLKAASATVTVTDPEPAVHVQDADRLAWWIADGNPQRVARVLGGALDTLAGEEPDVMARLREWGVVVDVSLLPADADDQVRQVAEPVGDQWVDRRTGEVVPGVGVRRAARVLQVRTSKPFRVRLEAELDGVIPRLEAE